jgi:hypothetical protein
MPARKLAALTGLFLAGIAPLFGQSLVFVSPSTKGSMTMTCAAGSLTSFEELHFLAGVHFLAGRLCPQSKIDGSVGLWRGRAENSAMIDGCSNDMARDLGALVAKYYQQKAALIFSRSNGGHATLISFEVSQPMGVIAAAMAKAQVTGATVIPHQNGRRIVMVAQDAGQRANARTLFSLLHAHGWQNETGTSELIGNNDRGKARDIYNALLAEAPDTVRELGLSMYTEAFNGLGLDVAAADKDK